jgi:hypothetical protein
MCPLQTMHEDVLAGTRVLADDRLKYKMGPTGRCALWSLYYMLVRISYPDVTPQDIFARTQTWLQQSYDALMFEHTLIKLALSALDDATYNQFMDAQFE